MCENQVCHELHESLGAAVERDHIIKLLEGLINTRPTETAPGWRGYSLERVIALIKGEQK